MSMPDEKLSTSYNVKKGNNASKNRNRLQNTLPIVWSVAGSDPSGGAGIQADMKTLNSLDVHGCGIITALTVQNTQGVRQVQYVPADMVSAQLEALTDDLPPDAVKLGMLGAPESIQAIAQCLESLKRKGKPPFVICDPVLSSTSGTALLPAESLTALQGALFAHVDLLTPNRPEAAILSGMATNAPSRLPKPDIQIEDWVIEAARRILALGVRSVLIKGGHADGMLSRDYWSNGQESFWINAPRYESNHTHGTGCALSSAIAASVAQGFECRDALVIARRYVSRGIRYAPGLGRGRGPLRLGHAEPPSNGTKSILPDRPLHTIPIHSQKRDDHRPWVSMSRQAEGKCHRFPDCGPEPLGFYPVVPSAGWVERLADLGVSTIQLRVKDLRGDALSREVARACQTVQGTGVRLFINDYWELALAHGAYGVHLGQEDLYKAPLELLEDAGIRLGVSTHGEWEVARALAIRPSYMAIGPVFPTTTKMMRFAPQGLASLRQWRTFLPDYPLVAIAGIFLENAPEVLRTGVDGIAVVRDILHASPLEERVSRWLTLFREFKASRHPNSEPLPGFSPSTLFDKMSG